MSQTQFGIEIKIEEKNHTKILSTTVPLHCLFAVLYDGVSLDHEIHFHNSILGADLCSLDVISFTQKTKQMECKLKRNDDDPPWYWN